MRDPLHGPRDQLPRAAVDARGLPPATTRGVKVVFAGTRQVYGKPDRLPVDETHLVRPTDVNGINKAAGEYYHLALQQRLRRARLLAAADQRLRAAAADPAQPPGLHRLVHPARARGQEIQIFGDGSQMRDFVYVDDAADAFLRAGASRRVRRRGVQRRRRASRSRTAIWSSCCIDVAGSRAGALTSPWPPRRSAIDIGSFYSDSSKFAARDGLGAARHPARGLRTDDRLLPRALSPRTCEATRA